MFKIDALISVLDRRLDDDLKLKLLLLAINLCSIKASCIGIITEKKFDHHPLKRLVMVNHFL